MLLIVILNVVMAVVIVSVMVALHSKAILRGELQQIQAMSRERRRDRRPEPRPAGARATRQPVGSAV
jgi:hypothetical protein